MATALTRIFSDLHFGDRASHLVAVDALAPLCEGASHLIFNGDSTDTRPAADPAAVAAQRATVLAALTQLPAPATLLTGNHDPDLSATHSLELANRQVFVTHGDILFDDLVPWGRDAADLRAAYTAELATLTSAERARLDFLLGAARRAEATIPQRHQSERNPWKYLVSFLADTIWPPTRFLRVIRAWRDTPTLAARLLAAHHLPARFFVMGHTHRVGATRAPGGLIVLNTGSFCPPGGTAVVDLTADQITLRAVARRGRFNYRLGPPLAEFPLAAR